MPWLKFVLKNFSTPIVFYLVFARVGAKPAIGFAVATSLIQLWIHRYYRLAITPFFLVASGFTVLFGSIDLFLAHPRYFRLEPAAQNFVMASVFLATVMAGTPIVTWFAQSLPVAVRPDLSRLSPAYFRNVTLAWVVYFLAKASLFLYLALHVDLGRLIILRTIIGGVTLALMVGGEIGIRFAIYGKPPR